jgi:hypothetical protein
MVFLADTWLHVATKTVTLVQVTPVTTNIPYSLALNPECTAAGGTPRNAALKACGLDDAADHISLWDGAKSLQALNNVSEALIVLTLNNQYAYFGVPPSEEVSRRDYTATTFGMQTQCRPVSKECGLWASDGASTPFNCSSAFAGDLTAAIFPVLNANFQTAYFGDSTMTGLAYDGGVPNPFYFGIAALNPEVEMQTPLREPVPGVVYPVHGGTAFVVFCHCTLYDIKYDSVNGTVMRFTTTPSNDSTVSIWQGAISLTSTATDQLTGATSLATLSNSAQELADKIAISYSRIALAVGAQSVVSQPALAAQERSSSLVTRLPVGPLFALLIANLLFVVLGIVLTILALENSDKETREVQARLSIVGLTASHCEGRRARIRVRDLDSLFEEDDGKGSMRVAIDDAPEGGYEYKMYPG